MLPGSGVGVGVAVGVSVAVGVGVAVEVAVGVLVAVGVGVSEGPGVAVGVAVGSGSAATAASTCIRLIPVTDPPERVSSTETPLDVRSPRISSTVAPGSLLLRIAHAPATCGAAIEVPFQLE